MNNLYWEHFTPKDYYNPENLSRFEVWINARYNKEGISPGIYGWLRVTFADSAGNFHNEFADYDYLPLEYNSRKCPAYVEGGDNLVASYLGSVNSVSTLGGGPGSGYSVLIAMAAGVVDAVTDESCAADTAIAIEDSLHISEIIYKAIPTR